MDNIEEKLKYENFNEETKEYINKAMDIYSTIMSNNISKRYPYGEKYKFTKLDKKILSLFTASFIANGKLKELLEEYDDLKLQDFLSYGDISEDKIKKLNEDEYLDFYNKSFKLDLINIIQAYMYDLPGKEINYISPIIIVDSLKDFRWIRSRILEYFWKDHDIDVHINDHPLFRTLENYSLTSGSISKKSFNKQNSKKTSENISEKSLVQTDFSNKNILFLLDEIKKKFIGQETLAEYLFYNIINNQKLVGRNDINDGERSIIFIDGPTGTGKTAITREITEKLNIPFTSTSITNYSSTGYVGDDIIDTLVDLLKKSDGDIEKAQRGIIVFDEFDKIAYDSYGGLEMKKAVQQQLLDFMSGGKYRVSLGMGFFGSHEIEFNTSNLTFVCLGALTNLRAKKVGVNNFIGFGDSNKSNKNSVYSISPEDLVNLGLERELVGRFNTYLHSEEYSCEALLKILKESSISPMLGFKKWINLENKTLEIEDGVEDLIAEEAYKLNTGARSLQTIINNIRTYYIKDVLIGEEKTIYLDLDTVRQINEDTLNRRVRM